jgi:hypothetical protein
MRQNIGAWLLGYQRFIVVDWREPTIRKFRWYEDADRAFKNGWKHSSDFLGWHRKKGWSIVMSVSMGDGVGPPEDPREWATRLGL